MTEIRKEPQCMYKYKDGYQCQTSTHNGARGLCTKHFGGYRYRVQVGKRTWEELEDLGLVKKKLSQDEKNINQMHTHRSYTKRRIAPEIDKDPTRS